MSKFELYKHNDELFNNIAGFFMNFELLPILTDSHLGYKSALTDTILKGDHPGIMSAKFG
jgi:hypothetical protein